MEDRCNGIGKGDQIGYPEQFRTQIEIGIAVHDEVDVAGEDDKDRDHRQQYIQDRIQDLDDLSGQFFVILLFQGLHKIRHETCRKAQGQDLRYRTQFVAVGLQDAHRELRKGHIHAGFGRRIQEEGRIHQRTDAA